MEDLEKRIEQLEQFQMQCLTQFDKSIEIIESLQDSNVLLQEKQKVLEKEQNQNTEILLKLLDNFVNLENNYRDIIYKVFVSVIISCIAYINSNKY